MLFYKNIQHAFQLSALQFDIKLSLISSINLAIEHSRNAIAMENDDLPLFNNPRLTLLNKNQ
jgi:hypothetical protein